MNDTNGRAAAAAGLTLVELAESGRLAKDGRVHAIAASVRFGLGEARAVPLRRAAYCAWAALAAACSAWILFFFGRRTSSSTFGAAVAIQSAWLVSAVFLGYVHLGLVRRDDGTPRRAFLVPNGLTFLRLSLAPLLGFASAAAVDLRPDAPFLFWLLVFLVVSDILDGHIARLFDMRSEWGRLADPFADIFTVTWFTAGLWAGGMLEPWFAIPVIVRYAGTLLAVFAVWSGGNPVRIEATVIGKATNFAVLFALPAVLAESMMWLSWSGARWIEIVLYVTAALVYANMAYYAARLWNVTTSRP